MCSLAWTMIRRYMPSTVASLFMTLTLRWKSAAARPTRAVLTAFSERFNQLMTSGFAVTVFSMSADLRSSGILGPVRFSKPKFASAMCMKTSLLDRTPGARRTFPPGWLRPGRRAVAKHGPILRRIPARGLPEDLPGRAESSRQEQQPAIAFSCFLLSYGDYHDGKHGSVKLQFTADEAIHPDAGLQRTNRRGALHLARPHRAAAGKHGAGTGHRGRLFHRRHLRHPRTAGRRVSADSAPPAPAQSRKGRRRSHRDREGYRRFFADPGRRPGIRSQ